MLKVTIFVLLATTHGQQHFSDSDLKSWISEDFRFHGDQGNIGTGGQGRTGGAGFMGCSRCSSGAHTHTVTTSNTVRPDFASESQKKTCTTKSGLVGECIPYSLCRNTMTHGIRIYDYRKDRPCLSFLDTCCPLPNSLHKEVPSIPPTASDEEHQGCGWRNPDGVGSNITEVVDNEAKFGEFPWMVAILEFEPIIKKGNDLQKVNIYVQGGSLIHPSVVLTTAWRLTRQSRFRVRVGEWDTQTNSELYPHQDRDVKEVVIHENFKRGYLTHDVALLFLSEPVDMSNPHIGLACLPSQGKRASAGIPCLASGWGKDQFGQEGRYQVILKKIEMPVISRRFCQSQIRETDLGADFLLHSKFMCAGGEVGKDTCVGDGGSPLVCPIRYGGNRYVQNGIVAWGVRCGEGVPSVFVDVGVFRDWIDREVAGRGYDTNTYTY